MTKYISAYESKSGDRKLYCLVCSDTGIRKARGIGSHITVEEFPLNDIIRVNYFTGDRLAGDMASGAAAGLLLGGAKGAIIGGMLTSGSSESKWIEIRLKDRSERCFRLYRGSDIKAFLKWAKQYGVKVKAVARKRN